jgi:hypothetical protein
MKIYPLRKQYLFVMHSITRQDVIKSKHLKQYLLIVQQLEKSGSQPEVTCIPKFNFSPQLAASRAKKNNNTLYIRAANCRIPHVCK